MWCCIEYIIEGDGVFYGFICNTKLFFYKLFIFIIFCYFFEFIRVRISLGGFFLFLGLVRRSEVCVVV